MEPEGSLQCSQEPSTGPHPEPDESSPYHPNSKSVCSWCPRFPTEVPYAFFSPCVLHSLPILSENTYNVDVSRFERTEIFIAEGSQPMCGCGLRDSVSTVAFLFSGDESGASRADKGRPQLGEMSHTQKVNRHSPVRR
jgi:hypothetical protein